MSIDGSESADRVYGGSCYIMIYASASEPEKLQTPVLSSSLLPKVVELTAMQNDDKMDPVK